MPTIAEADIRASARSPGKALFAPAGTPKEVLDTLNKTVLQAMEVAAGEGKLSASSTSTSCRSKSSDEAKTWLQDEIALWKKITDEVKIDLTE